MKRRSSKTKYYATQVQKFMVEVLTALSFLMIAFSFGYAVYYLICFDFCKMLSGCVMLYLMTHLNKSL